MTATLSSSSFEWGSNRYSDVVTAIHVLDLMVGGYTEGLLGATEGLLFYIRRQSSVCTVNYEKYGTYIVFLKSKIIPYWYYNTFL